LSKNSSCQVTFLPLKKEGSKIAATAIVVAIEQIHGTIATFIYFINTGLQLFPFMLKNHK
jgi:hypothetical protein